MGAFNASAATLVAEWDDFSAPTVNYSPTDNTTPTGYTYTSGDYSIVTSTATTTSSDGEYLNIEGANPAPASIDLSAAGLTFTNGITINMRVRNCETVSSSSPNTALFSVATSATTNGMLVGITQSNASGGFAYNGSDSKITTTQTTPSVNQSGLRDDVVFSYVTVTIQSVADTTKPDVYFYYNGVLSATGTVSTWNIGDAISKIYLGGWSASDNSRLQYTLDSLSVYNGAMSADEVAKLVPEPTTATLSLLALCGLAARRRRK